jgi:hypothetical protein
MGGEPLGVTGPEVAAAVGGRKRGTLQSPSPKMTRRRAFRQQSFVEGCPHFRLSWAAMDWVFGVLAVVGLILVVIAVRRMRSR